MKYKERKKNSIHLLAVVIDTAFCRPRQGIEPEVLCPPLSEALLYEAFADGVKAIKGHQSIEQMCSQPL